jgi:hypothetical protein
MQCPDPDRLFDLLGGDAIDREVREHVESCATCGAELLLMSDLGDALRPEVAVPEELIQRVVAGFDVYAEQRVERVPAVHSWASGLLGAVTTLAVLLGTGAFGNAAPLALAMSALLVGVVSGLAQARPTWSIGWPGAAR